MACDEAGSNERVPGGAGEPSSHGGSSGSGNHGGSNSRAGSSGNAEGGAVAEGGSAEGGTGAATMGGAGEGGEMPGGSAQGGEAQGGDAQGGAEGTAEGGSGGEAGGATVEPEPETLVLDFESGTEGFATAEGDVTLASSSEQAFSGAKSLKVTLPALQNASRQVYLDGAAFWPGTKLTLRVWTPAGTDGLWVQAFSLIDFYEWDTTNSSATGLARGGWTTWTYVVPATFPGGMQRLGFQIGADASAFAGGDVYFDAIATSDVTVSCSGAAVTRDASKGEPTSFDFEGGTAPWEIDGDATGTALSQSADQKAGGSSSLGIALSSLPVGAKRHIRVPGPNAFCGSTASFKVWTQANSDGLAVQIYAQYNDWAGWQGVAPAILQRGDWTTIQLPLPSLATDPALGPGGLQAIGIELENQGSAAFSGNVYVDDVTFN